MKIRQMTWIGYVARMWIIGTHKLLLGKAEGKRPLGRPRRSRGANNKIHLGEIRLIWTGLDWSVSGYEQSEEVCEHGNEPSG
jgi:hypothetical protein